MAYQFPESIDRVVRKFSKLSGVGEKTAIKYVLDLSKWEKDSLLEFSRDVESMSDLNHCIECGAFAQESICTICSNPKRLEEKTLCIVEGISDFMAIENSEQYFGSYHILGGVLNPLLGIGPDELGMDKLTSRIKERGFTNIILAINPSVEGDATCSYIKEVLGEGLSIDRIGFGIPMGGSLEYLDSMTISKALEYRRKF